MIGLQPVLSLRVRTGAAHLGLPYEEVGMLYKEVSLFYVEFGPWVVYSKTNLLGKKHQSK